MNHPVIVDPDPIHLIAPITPLQQQKQQMLHLLLQLPEPQQGVVLQVTRLLETTTPNILVNHRHHRHRQNQTRVMSLEVAITRGNR